MDQILEFIKSLTLGYALTSLVIAMWVGLKDEDYPQATFYAALGILFILFSGSL